MRAPSPGVLMRRRDLLYVLVLPFLSGCGDGPSPSAPSPAPGTSGVTGSCAPPPAPSGLHVVSIVGTTVELAWTPTPGADVYVVLVGTTPGGTETFVSDTSQASIRWGGVSPGRHFARVQAHTACGNGPSTGSIEFTVPEVVN